MRVAVYARLSDDRQGQSTGVDRQLEACRSFAASRGWEIVAEHSDSDLSAFRRGVVRPGYEAMLAELSDVDAVLVWKLDRLVRRFLEFARVWPMFEANHVALVSATEPIDTSSAIGRIIVLMLVGFAELESENISLRQKAKHAELRRQGRPSGGGRQPYPDEMIVDACVRILAGESTSSIARSYGIEQTHLRRALRSPRLIGRRQGQEVADGSLRPLVSPETFDAVQAVLARRTQPSGPGPARRHLLSGFLWCDQGHRMETYTKKRGRRHYRCLNGGHLSIVADPLDELIAEGVMQRADSPAVAVALERRSMRGGTDRFLEQLQADEEALEELARARFVERLVTDAEYRVAREALVARITHNRDRLQVRDAANVLVRTQGKARALWGSADLSWRRALVGAIVDRVTILPAARRGPGLDPSRVEVSLRA